MCFKHQCNIKKIHIYLNKCFLVDTINSSIDTATTQLSRVNEPNIYELFTLSN